MMGTEAQKERFFGIFADHSRFHYGAYALTEPGAGTDAAAIQTSARRDGGHYVLNGTKCFISNGAKADWVVVFATIDKAAGRAGHRAFVVERGTPGFRVGKIEEKMGLRASETAELVFEDCRIPADNLLGGEALYERSAKGGFVGAMATFDATRPAIGAMAVGIARASIELARDFVRSEYAVNPPSARYLNLQERLAAAERQIEAARLLCWRAAWLADLGQPNTKEAAFAKAYAAQMAMRVCADAVQICGPLGTLEGQIVEKCFRDIKVYDIFEGTAQAQRMVISKRIIEGLPRF
jgi:acyl-CoA dehydrogenase